MAKNKNRPTWNELKTEYVTSEVSYRTLADKYHISRNVLMKHGKDESWVEARNQYKAELLAKTVEKVTDDKSDKLAVIAKCADKMGTAIEKAMNDSDQFFRHMTEEGVEFVNNKIDSKAVKEMTSAIKELTQIFRDVYNIPTEQQNVSLQLARERLEIERRNSEKEDLEYGVSAGVVLIPPVDEEDDEEE